MAKRTLRLVKESLTPLDNGALGSVVGGYVSLLHPQCVGPTFQIDCLNDLTFEYCPMATLPIEQCI